MTYDVIVVGAGPAGSIAARDCARLGFKTLLLEKYPLPREKPCGGAVMYRGLRLIGKKVPGHIVEQRIFGLRFLLPDGRAAEFSSDKLIGITVFRDRFDELLARSASDAGADLLESARVVDVTVSSESANVRLEDGREYSAKYLLGADGVNSVVSRALGLRPKRKDLTKVGLGMEADFHVGKEGVEKATGGNPSILEVCAVDHKVSYGWVFPKREHLAIGIAGAGVQGGIVYGSSDKDGQYPTEHKTSPEDLAATIYHAMGIDPKMMIEMSDGRPIPLVGEGEPIREIFG